MRIGELSRATGVSVASIKYYLREGLLMSGRSAGAANQADYDQTHVHRLHLVRTLLGLGGLGIGEVRRAVAAIDDPSADRHEMLAAAHSALDARAADDGPDVAGAREHVDAYLDELGWVGGDAGRAMLADALVTLRRLGRDVGPEVFAPYVAAADALAEQELAALVDAPGVMGDDALVEAMIVGTVVFERALIALRRLAQANHSARRFGHLAEGDGVLGTGARPG